MATNTRVSHQHIEVVVASKGPLRVSHQHIEVVVGGSCDPPINDNVDYAIVLVGDSGSASGTTTCGSFEPGETWLPGDPPGSEGGTVWYAWTALATGVFGLTFTAGILDTSPDVTQLWSVRNAPDVGGGWMGSGGPWWAPSTVDVEAGQTYYIQVGSPDVEFTFEWSFVSCVPPNDNWANAEVLVGDSGFVTGTTVCATSEPDEPSA